MSGGVFTVLRGQASPEELAAVVAVVMGLAGGAGAESGPNHVVKPHWHARRRITHARGRHLPAAAWTGAGGPWPGPDR
jgi:hypothetical protein